MRADIEKLVNENYSQAYLGANALLLCRLADTSRFCALDFGSDGFLGGGGSRGRSLLGLGRALDGRLGIDGLEDARLGVAGSRAGSFACHFFVFLNARVVLRTVG